MAINPIMKIIRAKKLGVLIRDVRLKAGKSVDECAQAMGISSDEFTAMEFGERPPTLPELELLAYSLGIPLEHFWGRQLFQPDTGEKAVDPAEITRVRQASIGELVQKGREAANLTVDELAGRAGISTDKLQAYEDGELAIPLPELESLALVLDNSILYYEDQQGPVGSWFAEQQYLREFQQLPRELKEFIIKPINRPFLEMAMRVSAMKVDQLRALGEGLLEITL